MIESPNRCEEQDHQPNRNASVRARHPCRNLMRGMPAASRKLRCRPSTSFASSMQAEKRPPVGFRDRRSRNRRRLASVADRAGSKPAHYSSSPSSSWRVAGVCRDRAIRALKTRGIRATAGRRQRRSDLRASDRRGADSRDSAAGLTCGPTSPHTPDGSGASFIIRNA